MKFVLYTNALSEHQMPLAREIVAKIGGDNFRYIYTSKNGQKLQESKATDEWIVYGDSPWIEEADVILVGGIRPIELMERRLKEGNATLYMSERWFKPICGLPGWIRMLVPSYWKMAKKFANLFKYEGYRFLPIGPWAKKDMELICKVFGVKVAEEKVVDWGYFVAPSENKEEKVVAIERSEIAEGLRGQRKDNILKVLWVGRMLDWKRVDTIIRAVARIIELEKVVGVGQRRDVSLTLVGDGPEKERLMKLAERVNSTVRLRASTSPIITFLPSQPIAKIREIMREHNVYVLASNGEEGWGAALNEAMEEGMKALGTYESGASVAMLPAENLFHCGDYRTLTKKLMEEIKFVPIGRWSAKEGAEKLLALNF